MIDVINIDGGLPISVIVPLQEKREYFFYQFALPLIKANNPSEIIINSNEGGTAKKRNEGFLASKNPFVLFADDDILFPKDYFKILYDKILLSKDCGYVYTGYTGIVLYPKTHNLKNNFEINTTEFNKDTLKESNFISNMALIRRDVFPFFDETIPRFLDYDIYLNMLSKGIIGQAVYGTMFYAFYLDEGITSVNNEFSYSDVQKKYKLK